MYSLVSLALEKRIGMVDLELPSFLLLGLCLNDRRAIGALLKVRDDVVELLKVGFLDIVELATGQCLQAFWDINPK